MYVVCVNLCNLDFFAFKTSVILENNKTLKGFLECILATQKNCAKKLKIDHPTVYCNSCVVCTCSPRAKALEHRGHHDTQTVLD